jgi:hypothetical protein
LAQIQEAPNPKSYRNRWEHTGPFVGTATSPEQFGGNIPNDASITGLSIVGLKLHTQVFPASRELGFW